MLSDKQRRILAFPLTRYRALVCHGSIRSGKTSIMTIAFVDWAMENFNGRYFGICGKTVGSAVMNIVRPYMSLSYSKRKYSLSYSRALKLLTVSRSGKTNTFEVAGGNDERSQDSIQGRTWAGVLLDEVALMPQSFVDQATARCSVDGSRLWFNCNPESPRHWFYKSWILGAAERNAYVIHFELGDNPSLSDEVKASYEAMYTGVFYDRFVRGMWVVAEGLVYQFDSEAEYTVSYDDARGADENGEDGRGHWLISIDYGTVNPFAALLWRITPDCAYVVDEYYWDSREIGRRLTDGEHYANVEKLAGNRPVTEIVVDPSAGSFKEEAWRRGRFDVIDADNDVRNGIAVTDLMLHRGAVKVSDRCGGTITEMGLYRWDDKAAKDQVIKENDHAMDAMRYACMTVAKYEMRGFA